MSSQRPNPMLLALFDEYKRAAIDLKIVLEMVSQEEFERLRDPHTTDPDCVSIWSVCSHVVRSGYTYANYLHSAVGGEWIEYTGHVDSAPSAIPEIDRMLEHTSLVMASLWYKNSDEIASWSFNSRWGTVYDAEQLLEHAIVHILRHRRQIEGFLKF